MLALIYTYIERALRTRPMYVCMY